jgi:hypothetical protein
MTRRAWLVGVGVFLVYCATLSGEGGSTYGQAYLTAQRLLERHTLSLPTSGPEVAEDALGPTLVNARGERQTPAGVLWGLVVLPFYAGAHLATGGAETGPRAVLGKLLTGLYDPLLYGLCAALLFSLALRMSGSPRRAWGIVLLWTFATMTWGVSKYSSYLSLLSCLLLGVVWFLAPAEEGRPGRFWAAGVCFGLVVLTRAQEAALLPAVILYAVLRARALPPERRARAGAAFAVPVGLGLAALALLDLHKFGLAHPFGYTDQPLGPLDVGLWGLLLSSGRSLFLFSPPLLLGVWCLARPQERWRPERAFLVAAAVSLVLFYASFRCWPGDWGDWGPRYLYPLVPLLLLPLALVERTLVQPVTFRRAALALGVVGVLAQMPGVLLRSGAYQWPLRVAAQQGAAVAPVDSYFWPQFSPVFMGYRLLYAKAESALTGLPPEITLQIYDFDHAVRSATVEPDAEMLRNSDFVSHTLFSLQAGSFRASGRVPLKLVLLLRTAQALVWLAGLVCLLAAGRREGDSERRG